MKKLQRLLLHAFVDGLTGWAILFAALASGDEIRREAHRVVLLGPTGPLLLDVRIETGAQTIGQVRDAFCQSLFKRLDTDNSGKLDGAELALVPVFRRPGAGEAPSVQTFLADGVLTVEGLRRYVDGQLGPEFGVEVKAPRLDQSVQLVNVLDSNGDGVLSLKEVIQADKALTRYDLDDDESLSVRELQPFPQSVRQAQRAQEANQGRGVRVSLIDGSVVLANVVAEMTKQYGGPQGLAVARCGLREELSRRFDQDADGHLNAAELRRWITDGSADLAISATWRRGGLPPVLEVKSQGRERVVEKKGVSRSRWAAVVDGVPMSASLKDNRSAAGDAVSLFVNGVRQRDADKNGYLDETEFAGLGTGASFSAVDLNRDGMVYADEIRTYFSEMSRLSQARVVMTVGDDVTSLFQLMDADRTNRLSPRELATLADRLGPFDRNGNGQFDAADFVSEFSFSLAFSVPAGLEFTPSAMSMNNSTGGVLRSRLGGPLWFQRMDRNRDGDISWREFLGSRTKFDSIDQNRDGLISIEEAEAAIGGAADSTPPATGK